MGKTKIDTKGFVIAFILIVVGIVAIWDTTSMVDSDSYVFPRAIAIAMIGFCTIFIAIQFIKPTVKKQDKLSVEVVSNTRRVGLVLVMLISALLMPFIGFILSGLLTFGSLILASMYDPWTLKRKILYPLIGVVIVFSFYVLFAKILLVPLPIGILFE